MAPARNRTNARSSARSSSPNEGRARRLRRHAEAGQALLWALVAMLVTALLVAVFATLWVRGTVRARSYGDMTAARYAAEAGISRALAELAAGALHPPASLSGSVEPAAGPATYQVVVTPDGPGRWVLNSTGVQRRARYTVEVAVVAPFTMPVYAGGTLTLHVVPSGGRVDFSMSPGFGRQGGAQGSGSVTPAPVKMQLPLPDFSFATFAALAGTPPAQRQSLAASGGVLLDGAWFDGGPCGDRNKGRGASLTVPAGATVGVLGDLRCPAVTLEAGSTLVVTGALAAEQLALHDGARLVVGTDADPQDIAVYATSGQPRPVLLVVGGSLDVKGALAGEGGGMADVPLAILALDRRGCTLPACGDDVANRIAITDLQATEFLLYSEPKPAGASSVCVEIGAPGGNTSNRCHGQGHGGGTSGGGSGAGGANQGQNGNQETGGGSGAEGGAGRLPLVQVRGAVLAGGDVTVIARHVQLEWSVGFDLLARYLGVLPGQAFYTLAGWRE